MINNQVNVAVDLRSSPNVGHFVGEVEGGAVLETLYINLRVLWQPVTFEHAPLPGVLLEVSVVALVCARSLALGVVSAVKALGSESLARTNQFHDREKPWVLPVENKVSNGRSRFAFARAEANTKVGFSDRSNGKS